MSKCVCVHVCFFSHLHLKTFAFPKHKSIQWKKATWRTVKAGLRLNICSKVIHGVENSQVIECWLIFAFLARRFMTCSKEAELPMSGSFSFFRPLSKLMFRSGPSQKEECRETVLTDWLPRAEKEFGGLLTPDLQFWIGFCPRQAWSLPLSSGRHYLSLSFDPPPALSGLQRGQSQRLSSIFMEQTFPACSRVQGREGGACGINSGVEGLSFLACPFPSKPYLVCVPHMFRINYWKLKKWLEGESLPVAFISVPW